MSETVIPIASTPVNQSGVLLGQGLLGEELGTASTSDSTQTAQHTLAKAICSKE